MSNQFEVPEAPKRILVDMFNEVPAGTNEEAVRAAAISIVSRAYLACHGDMDATVEMVKDALALGLGAMQVAHEDGLSANVIALRRQRHAKH